MKTEVLIDAIGKIDALYVEEAELWTPKAGRSERKVPGFWSLSWKRTLATAACFALIVTGLFVALRNPGREDMTGGAHMGANNLKGSEGSQEAGGSASGMENGASDQADGAGQPYADAPGDEATERGTEADTVKNHLLEALGDTESIAVTRYSGGSEEAYTLEAADLEALKEWINNLTLGEEVTFEEGAYPGEASEGGEVYYFEALEGGTVFSYRDFGDCYLVFKDHWYPVLNPAQPPLPD